MRVPHGDPTGRSLCGECPASPVRVMPLLPFLSLGDLSPGIGRGSDRAPGLPWLPTGPGRRHHMGESGSQPSPARTHCSPARCGQRCDEPLCTRVRVASPSVAPKPLGSLHAGSCAVERLYQEPIRVGLESHGENLGRAYGRSRDPPGHDRSDPTRYWPRCNTGGLTGGGEFGAQSHCTTVPMAVSDPRPNCRAHRVYTLRGLRLCRSRPPCIGCCAYRITRDVC